MNRLSQLTRKSIIETIIIGIAGLLSGAVNADTPASEKEIQVLISPECKDMFYGPDILLADEKGNFTKIEKREKPDYVPWDPARAKPMVYVDPNTSISLYVETDGRHLAAIGPEGNLLWVRNPYEDQSTFCPYRTARPVIWRIEAAEIRKDMAAYLKKIGADVSHKFVLITFDSSQFGVLDVSTGEFFPGGQN